ncbi:DUF2975 domain-containing protein [Aquimarina sp. AU474]|uniref:DUF2975 domain-containing protein n=1 Tax=Aquimarina sp. AU474 TaxID=2108529 RepID=UPI000D687EC5|nr:DUF2975 domain-containing protein [Aquimarina sp. AU474]
MKPITILKKLITIFYYLIGLGIFTGVFTLLLDIFNQKEVAPSLLKGETLYSLSSIKVIIAEVLVLLLSFAFFKAISFLKHSLNDLSEGNPFTDTVIRNFKNVGILFVICGFGELLGKFTVTFLIHSNFAIEFDSSIVLFPVIGLFFMYLSEVFSKARDIQSENELTV